MKKFFRYLVFNLIFTLLVFNQFNAQVTASDCADAVNICTNQGFTISPNGPGVVELTGPNTFPYNHNLSNPDYDGIFSTNPWGTTNSGCLRDGETNSTWMIINIATSGTLEMSFGAGGAQNGYYDWAMWPYNTNSCSLITGNNVAPVRCNWNFDPTGGTGIANTIPPGGSTGNYEPGLNVTCGDKFIICFSNWSATASNVPINFFGSATVSCTNFIPITVNDETVCEGDCATLVASGGTSYNWIANAALNNTTGSTVQACPSSPGTHSFTVNGSGPCGAGSAVSTVTVLPSTDPSCSTPCSFSAISVVPTVCDLTTGNFDISGVLDFVNPPSTGQLIVENCSGDQTIYTPPFSSPLNYVIAGILADGTNNCTVTATFTDDPTCTIVSSLFTEPTCVQPCSLIDVSVALTACDNINGLTYSGDITFLNQPSTGQLTVTDCHGIQQTFNAPFVSPTTYTLSGIPADGQPCQITATFSADPTCTFSAPFNPTNSPYVHAMNDTAICLGNPVSLYVDSVSGGILVEEFNMVFDQAFSHTTINTNLSGTYYAVVSGTYSGAGNCELRDAGFLFYQGCSNISPISGFPWKWNGLNPNTQSQVPSVYNPNHIYQFYFSGGAPQTYTFSEAQPNWYNDNFGTLNFKIYYLGNLSWSNGVTTTTNSVNPTVATTYTVTVDYGNGCNASHTLDVDVSDIQSSLLVQDVTCVGACDGFFDANISGGIGPISYDWSHDPTITVDSAGSLCADNYNLIVTDSIGCSITINDDVNGTQVITINQLDTISELCFNDSTGQATVYSTGAYFFSIDSVNFQADSAFSNLGSGNYTIYLMDSNSCKNSISFTLISPPELILQANGDTTICIGGSAVINAVASGGTGNLTYFWNNVNSLSQFTVSPIVDSMFYVSVIDDNGCRSDTDFVTVSVNPNLSMSPIQDQNLCIGDSVFILANVLGGDGGPYNYSWSPIVSFDSTQYLSPLTTNTYTITVSDNCETPDINETFTINVFPSPTVQFSGDILSDCSPLVTNFTSNVAPIGSQCLWSFGDGTTSNICGNVTHTFVNSGCYDISLTATSPQGCETSVVDSQYVCVYDYPIPSFIWSPDTPTVINSFVEFYNNSIDAVSYQWTVNVNGQITTFSDENISFNFPNFESNSYEVCLTATSDFGCDSTYCGMVEIVDKFLIYTPNAFSPGLDDDINKVFKPVIYGAEEDYYELFVFNRSGELIFSTQDVNEGWNGEHDGVPSQFGVYVWKVIVKDKFTSTLYEYVGDVTLVK